jgi:hypothetical protein
MVGLIRQELLSGIKITEQYEKLRVHLRSFPDQVVDTSDYEEAAKAGNRCRAKGVAVSMVDILYVLSRSKGSGGSSPLTLIFRATQESLPLRIHTPRRAA